MMKSTMPNEALDAENMQPLGGPLANLLGQLSGGESARRLQGGMIAPGHAHNEPQVDEPQVDIKAAQIGPWLVVFPTP